MASCYFGYDPVENQYKALLIPLISMEQACHVFTLGDPTAKEWRKIQSVVSHYPMSSVVCLNGVIHYIARVDDGSNYKYKLMCFDFRSEKFYHVEAPKTLMDYCSILINYQGKLGFVCREKGMEIWVREDVNKGTPGWSMIFFYEMEVFKRWRVLGATPGGEIVFADKYYLYRDVLHVLYYDPKRNSMRYVDLKVKGTYLEENRWIMSRCVWRFWTAPDHVENTMCLHHIIS